MDNQYNYNTPNDQFQNQAMGNGGPDFHFGQTDPDFSHRKKEKKPRDHKKAAKIAGGLCFAVAFGVIASAAFQTTNFVGNALFGEKVKTEKSSEKKVDSTSLTRTSSTVTSDVSEVVNGVMPSVVSITNRVYSKYKVSLEEQAVRKYKAAVQESLSDKMTQNF